MNDRRDAVLRAATPHPKRSLGLAPRPKPWLLGLMAFLMTGCGPGPTSVEVVDGRGTRPRPQNASVHDGFDPQESFGIFVGVRQFRQDDQLSEAPYAVDDAVDLAYVDQEVTKWVESNQGRRPDWLAGIESTLGGPARDLPLNVCSGTAEDEIWDPITGCDGLLLDLDAGKLGDMLPTASTSAILAGLPCTPDVDSSIPGLGSVQVSERGVRFSPDRQLFEVDASFRGRLSLGGTEISLLGESHVVVLTYLGEPSQRDGSRALLYDRSWGCLQIKLEEGNVSSVTVHGRYCHEVPLRRDVGG